MDRPGVKAGKTTAILCIVILATTFPSFGSELGQLLPLAHEGIGFAQPVLSTGFDDQVSWLPVANAGLPFGRASGGVLGEYFYVFGAEGEPRAQAYNWATDHWELSTAPLLGDCNWCGVATDEAIYLIGRYYDYSLGNEVQKFIPLSGGPGGYWTTVANYPLAVAGLAGAWDGGSHLYTAGGSDLTEIYANAYCFDIDTDEWMEIAPLPIPMTYHGGAFVDGKFHVMGGVQDLSTAHFAYDPSSNSWTEKAEMPIPNYFATFSLTRNDDFIFSIGGGGGYYIWPATNAVQIYDPVADSWMQEIPLPMAYGLNSAAFMPDTSVTSTGGFDGISFVQQTYKGTGFPSGGVGFINENEVESSRPVGFAFYPAYPNPFNAEVHLSFTLPTSALVELVMFDASCRRVACFINEIYPAGIHEMDFNASRLSAGVYLASLSAGKFRGVQKLLLIK